jgi:hypothetical protein
LKLVSKKIYKLLSTRTSMPPKRKLQYAKQPVSSKGHAGKKTQKEVEEVVEKEGAAVAEEVSKEVAKAATLEVSKEVAAVAN